MAALGIATLVLALWFIQGLGFVRWLAPSLREDSIVEWVAAIWAGSLISLIVVVELYYVIPGATIGQLAWPVTLVISSASLALYFRSGWRRPKLDGFGIAIIAITVLGTVAVLRTMIGYPHLAFYSSNNGEFANYAGLADAVQFHGSAETIGGLGIHSREAVSSLYTAVIARLTNVSALWVLQPVAAAIAALAFASLGLVMRRVVRSFSTRRSATIAIGLVYAWASLSAATQCFFTLSFVSQYLCVALWFGALALLVELPRDAARTRIVVIGLTLGAITCVYPEMIVPAAAMLAACELSGATRKTFVQLAIAIAIAAVIGNRLAFELIATRVGSSRSGWNIYGDSHPALGFFAALTGFTNPFSGPKIPHVATAGLAAAGVAVAAIATMIAAWREPRVEIRVLAQLALVFAIGVIGIFWIVAKRGNGNNYIALKFILGFGWLGYLALAIAIARLASWKPPIAYAALALVLVASIDLSRTAIQFSKSLYRARDTSLYDQSEVEACRAAIGTRPAYIADNWFDVHIIGMVFAYDHDIVSAAAGWPDRTTQHAAPGAAVIVVNGFDIATDPQLAGRHYDAAWVGHHVAVMVPR